MKLLKTALLTSAMLLAGCAGSGQSTVTESSVHWWNPLTYSWSSVLPWHWFGSTMKVTAQGVGGLNSLTPMDGSAIHQALGSDYHLRQGMGTENGDIVTFWQALKQGQVMLEIQGQSTISRITVTDPAIVTADGVHIGSPFSAIFSQAFGHCQSADNGDSVQCRSPVAGNIQYIFRGEGHGPEGIMPADATLKNWTLTKIIWQQ
ncbi:putative outer membrane lipoprotein [Tatumella ptyseos ATCC 33301]|uniref:RpoE-regulated lipoprotein n=2 Tax=Tatumella ptyseos TaxID=82987 RepID=A0A2X5NQR4_9GAMM|nr:MULTISPECIES: RpoE-regulated lipoprotein [Tatumella]KFD20070.1 putative outer membrane lipoprotein [Tatumella ptyseos ATCC 33301]SQK75851.1 RpoE-regulated lipoprotein [Tatumella ptyseos]